MSEKSSRGTVVLWAQSAVAFYVVFGLYTATAVFLLLLGLGAALAAASSAILEAFQDAALSGSRFAPVWTIVVATAPLSEAPSQVLLDYLLSGLNLGLGVLIVWRRPLDGVELASSDRTSSQWPARPWSTGCCSSRCGVASRRCSKGGCDVRIVTQPARWQAQGPQ